MIKIHDSIFIDKYLIDFKAISIIIPIFNKQEELEECLNSIIGQTLNNIEIICIDDGSTDNSSNILKKYSRLDNRFVVLNQTNKGSAFSRNRGIKISQGKFITFVDSDDLLYDNSTLSVLYSTAHQNKAIICGGGIRSFTRINNTNSFTDNIFEYEGFIKYKDYQYDYYYQRFIYNTNFLRKNKIYFPPYLRYQDPPFFIKAMAISKKFYVIKNITYKYRCSYKNLTLPQAIHVYYGFRDCLKIAEDMHLYKLYNLILNRLNSQYLIQRIKKYKNMTEFQNIHK